MVLAVAKKLIVDEVASAATQKAKSSLSTSIEIGADALLSIVLYGSLTATTLAIATLDGVMSNPLLAPLRKFLPVSYQQTELVAAALDPTPVNAGDTIGGFPITSGFGLRSQPTAGASTNHKGVDVGMAYQPLYSPVAAFVECDYNAGGYGVLAVLHPRKNGDPTFHAGHLENCTPGEVVPGQQFAVTGNTGVSTGPHLHWEQLVNGEHVHPTKGWLEIALTGKLPSLPGKAGAVSVVALRNAIMGHESGFDCSARNVHTGAAGASQILPSNIPSWSREVLGYEVTVDQFFADCNLQAVITDGKLSSYLSQVAQRTSDPIQQVKMVASWWYSGDPTLYRSDRPQCESDGFCYTSIAGYANDVVNRYQQQINQF